MSPPFEVRLGLGLGLGEDHREAAAALYYEAFAQLLAPILGDPAQALPLLRPALDLGRAVAAIELRPSAGDDPESDARDDDTYADDTCADVESDHPVPTAKRTRTASAEEHLEHLEHLERRSEGPSSDGEREPRPPPLERLVGVCGLHFGGRHFVDLRPKAMLRAFGLVDGLRRIVVGGLLDHRPQADELLIDGIAVLPGLRGQGIGALLLAEVERLARGQGLRALCLDVAAENAGAYALYRRCGFVERQTSSSWLVRRAYGVSAIRSMSKPLSA